MTRNQLEYARLLETRRSNMANEVLGGQQVQISQGNLAEVIRHNQAGESQQGRSLDEAIRHNVQTENLNSRSIQEGERSNRAREYETQRSNIAREHETLRSNVERENETARHNFVTEGQTNVSLSLSDQAQRELERSHRATETTNLLKVSEDARSNLARESETYRSNVAREREASRSNIANEQERLRSNLRSEELQKYGIDLNYELQHQSNLTSYNGMRLSMLG